MTKVTGHFDGKVVIPDEPGKLKPNQSVTIEGEPAGEPGRGTVGYLMKHLTPISDEDAAEMRHAIDEARRTSVPSPDVSLD